MHDIKTIEIKHIMKIVIEVEIDLSHTRYNHNQLDNIWTYKE